MSWMGAIYTDAQELQMMVTAAVDLDPGELGERLREDGWVCPTVAGLACSLITSGQPADLERARRLLGGVSNG